MDAFEFLGFFSRLLRAVVCVSWSWLKWPAAVADIMQSLWKSESSLMWTSVSLLACCVLGWVGCSQSVWLLSVYCSLWNRCFSSQACWMFCCSLWLSHQHVNVPSIQSFQWWLWCFIGLVGFQVAFLWVEAVFRQFGCWNALGRTLCDIVLSFLDCFEITDSYERSLSS